MKRTTLAALLLGSLLGVSTAANPMDDGSYPAAPGFDAEGSDARAIEVAERTMEAMGGHDAWTATRYVTWDFFGRRRHLWDRHGGDVRIDTTIDDAPAVVVVNLHGRPGRAWIGGEPVDGERLAELLNAAEGWWINDCYWLCMPYKLKDTGVTLKHLGTGETEAGADADILQLTFREVGRTPQNKYHVYVGRESGLVEQWDFYSSADDAEPRFSTPWKDWRRYGAIMLSGDRGQLGDRPARLTGIAVYDKVPASAFTSATPPSMEIGR